ncbi:aspartate ammonia-lyase [Mesosutterella sp. AGMB02718]|uniref:Aspartate ammonia-lyase n=1 Tax=Mesosutterella faecium TaxID=2925194 RepID=A0ABT7IRJ8_9BURK|nr:aspartate ammonia-lyase [Mesosutterella sp. AGMB02718]MDL2060528.1 aspartate ammonia-lyase [Mesosutterella sp. AGMB02718]
MTTTRIEKDCLGEMEIPNDQYYGIQTHRMVKVSGAAGVPVIAYPEMHRALFHIKKCCALANADIGALEPEVAQAIAKAADLALQGRFDDQFPLDMWQGGGYTCVNMNVNEVLGNAANEILTGHKGQDRVHPNTHVNKAQSTNDTIPSATHLAMAPGIDKIIDGLDKLQASFAKKAEEFKDVVKVGRTCWQDALPLTLGQEFSGYASLMGRLAAKLRAARPGCFELVMGGSAVGTGLGADPGYMEALYRHLSEEYGETVRPMDNLFDGFQNSDFVVTVSGLVKEVAASLSKICKDLRLMSSGPRSGFMEIGLPALSPGSSIMPGKINPTVPEMVIQIAHQVIGNDVAITVAYDEGELDLNVWDSTFYKCIMENLRLVGEELVILRRDCVDGITANRARCQQEADRSVALSTVVAATFGYPEGVRVAHYCEQHNGTVKQAVVDMGLMTKEEAGRMIDPMLMTEPAQMARAIAQFKASKKA